MTVHELMSRDPACCTPATPLNEVARMMVECDCGEIPVVDNMQSLLPIGVITDRDITCRTIANDQNPLQMVAGDCMSTPCLTIKIDASLEDCCQILELHRVRRLPVVDDSGVLCGIVSQADIARKVDEYAAEVLKQVSQPSRRLGRWEPQ